MDIEIERLSSQYRIRRLGEEDVDQIFSLCSGNEQFYRFHPPFVTKESILEDQRALPSGKDQTDKYYLGFFEGDALAAVLDLILDYPEEQTAYIGFFMVDAKLQGRGYGSAMVEECIQYVSQVGYRKLRLAIDRGNPQSEAFWTKNGFKKTGEEKAHGCLAYVPMERLLEKEAALADPDEICKNSVCKNS